jgi:hypothetical protein
MATTPTTIIRTTAARLLKTQRAVLIDDTMLATHYAVYHFNGVRRVWQQEREALIRSCESELTGFWFWNDTTHMFEPSL